MFYEYEVERCVNRLKSGRIERCAGLGCGFGAARSQSRVRQAYHSDMARIPGTNLNTLEPPPNPPKSDEPCWCASGVPYGNCHLNRQDQIPESKWDTLRQMRQMHNMEYCTHPEASARPAAEILCAPTRFSVLEPWP